jgi:hypothetical protein
MSNRSLQYPRYGQRLAPKALYEILNIPIGRSLTGIKGAGNVLLSDLDEKTWEVYDVIACGKLAHEVVYRVSKFITSLPDVIANRHLPQIPVGTKIKDLRMEPRTINALANKGYKLDARLFSDLTIGEIARFKYMDAKCLVDLLVAMESYATGLRGVHQVNKPSINNITESQVASNINSTIVTTTNDFEAWFTENRILLNAWLAINYPYLYYERYSDINVFLSATSNQGRSGFQKAFCNLADIPGFGTRKVGNLIASLEAFIAWVDSKRNLDVEFKLDLEEEKQKILNLPSISSIGWNDPRLRSFLNDLDIHEGTLLEAMSEWESKQALHPLYIQTLIDRYRKVYNTIYPLSVSLLEDELFDLLKSTGQQERNCFITTRNLGWDGKGGTTLQETADEFGLTRERVRQIVARTCESIDGQKPYAPTLDRTLEFVQRQLPGSAEELESKLVAEGLTRNSFRLEGLTDAANRLGREVSFHITSLRSRFGSGVINSKRLIVRTETGHEAKLVKQKAYRTIEHWGMATIDSIMDQINEKNTSSVSKESITDVLLSLHDFSWLDESSGWFWLSSSKRNRLLNQIEKILSVTNPVDVAAIRTGITRNYRLQGFAPPRRVLLELCRQVPEYRVEGSKICAVPSLNWIDVLADTEETMVRILKTQGPILPRTDLYDLCLKEGMNRATFYMYLGNSPVIAQYARGVYGLAGAEIEPGIIESLIPQFLRPTRVLKDYGWLKDGRIWLAYRLSEAMIVNGAFGIPTSMKQHLQGDFVFRAESGEEIGTITIKGNNAWGLRQFYRRSGGDPGDYLILLVVVKMK